MRKAECWVPSPRTPATRRAIAHLTRLVNRIPRDARFATVAARLEKGWQDFCELRDVLQLTNAELPNGDPHPHQIPLPALEVKRLETIEKAAKDYEGELRERTANTGHDDSTQPSPAGIILKYYERYGDGDLIIGGLFHHPVVEDEPRAVLDHRHPQPQLHRDPGLAFVDPFGVELEEGEEFLRMGFLNEEVHYNTLFLIMFCSFRPSTNY